MYYKNGQFYEGEFIDGEMWGKGYLIKEEGVVYQGILEKAIAQGPGTMIYENGDIYEGEWVDDKPVIFIY